MMDVMDTDHATTTETTDTVDTVEHVSPFERPRGKWWITQHALERWTTRYEPSQEPHAAKLCLMRISNDALDTGVVRADGKRVFLHPDYPEARFVVAFDTQGRGRNRLPTLVTVIDRDPHSTRRGIVARPRLRGATVYDDERAREGEARERRSHRDVRRAR